MSHMTSLPTFQAIASWIPASCFAIVGVGTIVAPVFERLNTPKVTVLLGGIVASLGIVGASFSQSLAMLITLVSNNYDTINKRR